MHSFEVSLGYESVDRMYFGQRFHTPMKLQKNALKKCTSVNAFIPQ